MLKAFLRWIAYSFAIMFIAWIVPGISVENFWIAMLVSVIIALINTFIKPLIQIITLPINFITLGLFSFVINALLTPGFTVEGFLSSLFGSILLSLFGIFISKI